MSKKKWSYCVNTKQQRDGMSKDIGKAAGGKIYTVFEIHAK